MLSLVYSNNILPFPLLNALVSSKASIDKKLQGVIIAKLSESSLFSFFIYATFFIYLQISRAVCTRKS